MLTIDPPARHERRDRLDAEQRAGEVDADDAVPVGQLDLQQAFPERDAGVVDESVDTTVDLLDPRPELAPVLRLGNVEPPIRDALAELRIVLCEVGGDHRRTLARERRASAAPCPPAAPVTTTILPSTRPIRPRTLLSLRRPGSGAAEAITPSSSTTA